MKMKTLQLKSYAVDKGYTYSTLAAAAGLSRNTVSSVCNGKSCSILTASKLAKTLGVSLVDIAEE